MRLCDQLRKLVASVPPVKKLDWSPECTVTYKVTVKNLSEPDFPLNWNE